STLCSLNSLANHHQRSTMLLVVSQPLLGRHCLLLGVVLVLVDLGQSFEQEPGFVGKARCYLYKPPSGVRHAVTDDGCKSLGQVTLEAIAHLHGRSLFRVTMGQYVGEVFPGMLTPGKEQGNLAAVPGRYD